jgi:hypothetical protein
MHFREHTRRRDMCDRGLKLIVPPRDNVGLAPLMASNPVLATIAGSSFFCCPTLVSSIAARSKNSVSVAPRIRQVTVTPLFFNSWRNANEKLSRSALVPSYTA